MSVIVPCFNERGNIAPFLRQMDSALRGVGEPCEVVVVDDGSADGTTEEIWRWQKMFPWLKTVRIPHRQGQSMALQMGLERSRGEVIATIDADLQCDPAEIPVLLKELRGGWDVVSGWRKERKDSASRRFQARCFRAAVLFLFGERFHDMNSGLKVYRRAVLESIPWAQRGAHRYTLLLALRGGFRVIEVPVSHRKRGWGSSKYGWERLLTVPLDLARIYFRRNGHGSASNGSRPRLRAHYERLGDLRNDFRNRALFQWVCRRVGPGPVLDFGCSSGGLLRLLAERGKVAAGIEPDPALVRMARQRNPGLEIREGGVERVKEIPGPYGTVTLIDVLEHLPDDAGVLRQLAEVLSPGGSLIVVVPAYPRLYSARDRAVGHCRRYTKKGLVGLLRGCGYRVQRVRYWNMLGVAPYALFHRLLGRLDGCGWREESGPTPWGRLWVKGLGLWYSQVENRFSLGFGLSLLCVASPSVRR